MALRVKACASCDWRVKSRCSQLAMNVLSMLSPTSAPWAMMKLSPNRVRAVYSTLTALFTSKRARIALLDEAELKLGRIIRMNRLLSEQTELNRSFGLISPLRSRLLSTLGHDSVSLLQEEKFDEKTQHTAALKEQYIFLHLQPFCPSFACVYAIGSPSAVSVHASVSLP